MEHDKAVIINEGVVDTRKWTKADCLKVEELLQKISGKYTLHLLAILALYGEKSFGQLRKEMHPISTKVLYQCLTQLKEHGLIANRREILLHHSRARKVLAHTRGTTRLRLER